MKKLISSIAVVGLLGASTLSADTLSKSDSEFLGLTSTNAITLNSNEMVETNGQGFGIAALCAASGGACFAVAGAVVVGYGLYYGYSKLKPVANNNVKPLMQGFNYMYTK